MWEVLGIAIGLGCWMAFLSYRNAPYNKPKKPFNFTDKQRETLKSTLYKTLIELVKQIREEAAKCVEHHGRNCTHCNAFCAKKIADDIRNNKTYKEFEKVIHDRPTTFDTSVMDKTEIEMHQMFHNFSQRKCGNDKSPT